jgi:acyl-CoA thioesterase II
VSLSTRDGAQASFTNKLQSVTLGRVLREREVSALTTESEQAQWSVEDLLKLFEVQAAGPDRFTADTGLAGQDGRQVVEGTQVVAQAIVAVASRFQGKSIRSAHAVFARAVVVGPPIELVLDVVNEGRSTATAIVSAQQNGKRCVTVTVLTDVPTDDVIRHHLPRPDVAAPADANVSEMPMIGRELRLVDVLDVNSPDEVGPPELYAWLHYDPIPSRDDLAKALIAYFTGHLGISTTMRAHEGIGTAQAHLTVSTAPMTISVAFHEPVRWDGWLLYTHESTQVGAGMSYIRGAVHSEEGELLASFAQEALIRPLRTSDTTIDSKSRF